MAVRTKQSWADFSLKACSFLGVLLIVALFGTRYHLGFDSQDDRCLPDHWLYLIDRWDVQPERNNLYAFRGKGIEPIFPEGYGMLKKMVGMPGDEVSIDATNEVRINGVVVASGLAAAKRLDRPDSDFYGQGTIGPGRYWFTGETENSFDSRYWGTVADEQIIGRAYPLL